MIHVIQMYYEYLISQKGFSKLRYFGILDTLSNANGTTSKHGWKVGNFIGQAFA